MDEMPATLLTLPLNPEESVTGTVMSGRAVPAAMADAGVYVQVTTCPAVPQLQSEGLVAVPGVMPVGSVSVTVSWFASVPPLAEVPGASVRLAWLPASISRRCPAIAATKRR